MLTCVLRTYINYTMNGKNNKTSIHVLHWDDNMIIIDQMGVDKDILRLVPTTYYNNLRYELDLCRQCACSCQQTCFLCSIKTFLHRRVLNKVSHHLVSERQKGGKGDSLCLKKQRNKLQPLLNYHNPSILLNTKYGERQRWCIHLKTCCCPLP